MKNLSLALAGLFLAVLATPAVTADDPGPSVAPPPSPCPRLSCIQDPCETTINCDICTAFGCPLPCTVATCPPPCLECPILPPICISCELPPPPKCDYEQRECHPDAMEWRCEVGDPQPGGVVGDTLVYASWMAWVGCAAALSEANVALRATGDTTHYAYVQGTDTAEFVLGLTVNFPVSPIRPLVNDLTATAGAEVALVCSYLLGPSMCTGPASPPGTCPADLPTMGGQVGKALDTAEAACAIAAGGADAAAGHVGKLADTLAGVAKGVVTAVAGHAGEAAAGAVEHVGTMEGHAEDAAAIAVWAAETWVDMTCEFAIGGCP